MTDLSQLFNNESQSALYKSRPEYSPEIVEEIIKFWKKFNESFKIEKNLKIVDMGCGTGQLTNYLIPYAELLLGIDSSESQIKEARTLEIRKDFPKYIVGKCDDIPVPENSLDLITAALCVHWFDIDKFYAEVNRCLKPNGVLVILTSGLGSCIVDLNKDPTNQLGKFISELWNDDKYLGRHFCDKSRWAWELLPGFKYLYPSTGISVDNLKMEFRPTVKRYCEYVRSSSLYQRWKKCNPNEEDIVDMAENKILFYLGNPASGIDTELYIKFPLRLIMCSKC